jgi:hypothetical protein
MYVVAINHLHDPAGFHMAEALKNEPPPKFKLPIRGATLPSLAGNLHLGGPVLEEVQKLADSVVGPCSKTSTSR